MLKKFLILLIFLLSVKTSVFACTGFYVGKKVSENGTTIIARTRDSNNMQKVTRRCINERIENKKGRVYKEINGFTMPLNDTTYKYMSGSAMTSANVGLYGASCINEYGLAITATITATTRKEVLDKDPFVEDGISEACIGDIVAMNCKTSREGVKFLADVIKKYGNSEPNVILMADQNEAWLMETYTGHEWAAVKMPEDKIAIFGNQFMIDVINEKYDELLYSDDIELMPKEAKVAIYKNGKFDLFNTYSGIKLLADYSQMRNWYGMYLFSKEKNKKYHLKEKYPLFYTPNKKISFLDIKEFFRSRYENTKYCPDTNGRADIRIVGIETQYASDITEIYDDLPKDMCIISWISLDNSEHSVFIPFSNFQNEISEYWKKDLKEKLDYENDNIAFYAFQNLCVLGVEGRKSYGKGIREYWDKVEKSIYNNFLNIINKTKELYSIDKNEAIKYLTDYLVRIEDMTVNDAKHIKNEVLHYLALNQRTFDYKVNSESGELKGRYVHPDFKSNLLDTINERYIN